MHLVNILRIITFGRDSNFNNSDFNSFRFFWDTLYKAAVIISFEINFGRKNNFSIHSIVFSSLQMNISDSSVVCDLFKQLCGVLFLTSVEHFLLQ